MSFLVPTGRKRASTNPNGPYNYRSKKTTGVLTASAKSEAASNLGDLKALIFIP